MPGFTVKRIFDIIFSGIGLIVLSPVMFFLGLLILCTLGRPVFFVQPRIGWKSQTFYLLKFRTMRHADSAEPNSDADRLTSLGRFLRRSSMDELPELWNVLRGEMSLVGPRPLLAEYLPYYTPQQARRHDVRPGLTGWAQVNGRNATSWQERYRLDNEYIDRQGLSFDLYIILLTVLRVFDGRGVQNSKGVSMPRFDDEVLAGRTEGRVDQRSDNQVTEG